MDPEAAMADSVEVRPLKCVNVLGVSKIDATGCEIYAGVVDRRPGHVRHNAQRIERRPVGQYDLNRDNYRRYGRRARARGCSANHVVVVFRSVECERSVPGLQW